MKSFGKKMRKFRRAEEITLEQLAYDSGISVSHVKLIEKGTSEPTLPKIFQLCKALNVHPSELIDEAWDEWYRENKWSPSPPAGN